MSQIVAGQSIQAFAYVVPWLSLQLEALNLGDRIVIRVDEVCRLLGLDQIRETDRIQDDLRATVEIIALDGRHVATIPLGVLFQWLMFIDAAEVLPAYREWLRSFQEGRVPAWS